MVDTIAMNITNEMYSMQNSIPFPLLVIAVVMIVLLLLIMIPVIMNGEEL